MIEQLALFFERDIHCWQTDLVFQRILHPKLTPTFGLVFFWQSRQAVPLSILANVFMFLYLLVIKLNLEYAYQKTPIENNNKIIIIYISI